MARLKVQMGCRDCKDCMNSSIAHFGRNAGRGLALMATGGLSEVGMATQKKCRQCGHQLSLHGRSPGPQPEVPPANIPTFQPSVGEDRAATYDSAVYFRKAAPGRFIAQCRETAEALRGAVQPRGLWYLGPFAAPMAFRNLPCVLEPGEAVRGMCSCVHPKYKDVALLVLTDRRLICSSEPRVGRTDAVHVLPLSKRPSAHFESSWRRKSLVVQAGDQTLTYGDPQTNVGEWMADAINEGPLTPVPTVVTDPVREEPMEEDSEVPASKATVPTSDPFLKLRQLSALHEERILSDAEFEEKKRKILRQI